MPRWSAATLRDHRPTIGALLPRPGEIRGVTRLVQVVAVGVGCGGGGTVDVQTYACGAHEGADTPFRDWDGDGLSLYAGDCDDEDAAVGACG